MHHYNHYFRLVFRNLHHKTKAAKLQILGSVLSLISTVTLLHIQEMLTLHDIITRMTLQVQQVSL